MRILHKIIDELFFAGLSREDYGQIREAVRESNRKALISWSLCTAFFWIISLLLSLQNDAYEQCRMVFFGALMVSAFILVCTISSAKRFTWMVPAFVYLFDITLLGAGIGIALFQPDFRTATMVAIAVIMPSCFIERTFISAVLSTAAIIAFAVLGDDFIVPDVYTWGMTNLIIFSCAGVASGHIINKSRFERYLYAERAAKLAEMQTRFAYFDQMTGLKNRRAFSEMLDRFSAEMPENLSIVMADLNGLKAANDTYGHEAGDELLTGAAGCLTAAFAGTDAVFRIGGDEFCVILTEPAETAEACLQRLAAETAGWCGDHVKTLSVSCGFCSNREFADLDAILKEADRRMYESKREYYRRSGTDRRKRDS